MSDSIKSHQNVIRISLKFLFPKNQILNFKLKPRIYSMFPLVMLLSGAWSNPKSRDYPFAIAYFFFRFLSSRVCITLSRNDWTPKKAGFCSGIPGVSLWCILKIQLTWFWFRRCHFNFTQCAPHQSNHLIEFIFLFHFKWFRMWSAEKYDKIGFPSKWQCINAIIIVIKKMIIRWKLIIKMIQLLCACEMRWFQP